MWIYDVLSTLHINYDIFKLKFIDANSEPQMFLSFYLLNTFFLVLSVVMMNLITETKAFVATSKEKLLLVTTATILIVLSQFVLVPYDCSSYFLLLLFFYLLIKYIEKPSTKHLSYLGLILFVSTLNRESSALSISLAASLLYSKNQLKKETLFPVGFLAGIFVLTYLGLRFSSENFTTNDGNLLLENLTQPKNILGFLFWIVCYLLSLFLCKSQTQMKYVNIFHIFALPYILMCFYTGILYEIRLYIPLFITSLFLTQIEFEKK